MLIVLPVGSDSHNLQAVMGAAAVVIVMLSYLQPSLVRYLSLLVSSS